MVTLDAQHTWAQRGQKHLLEISYMCALYLINFISMKYIKIKDDIGMGRSFLCLDHTNLAQ